MKISFIRERCSVSFRALVAAIMKLTFQTNIIIAHAHDIMVVWYYVTQRCSRESISKSSCWIPWFFGVTEWKLDPFHEKEAWLRETHCTEVRECGYNERTSNATMKVSAKLFIWLSWAPQNKSAIAVGNIKSSGVECPLTTSPPFVL